MVLRGIYCCLVWTTLLAAEPPVVIETPMSPPDWALAEQALLDAYAEAAEAVADKYIDSGGWARVTANWGGMDGADDIMESFRDWPLLYILGAPESVLTTYKRIWEGHLQQFTEAKEPLVDVAKDGMYYKEFCPSFDWEHIGEGMAGWYWYGLARPRDPQYLIRARRFAGLYMNEDPEAPNYDPKHRIIRSLFNGSRGPLIGVPSEEHWAGNPRPRHDARPGKPRRTERFSRQGYLATMSGDHPLNLMTTNLAMTAYLLTHEEKYRDWILEYVSAWQERIAENGGNIPTNIGLDGTIGGAWDGKWYGGVYGWNFRPTLDDGRENPRHNMFIRGTRIAFGIALLLTGDQGYVDVMRRQFNNLYAVKKVVDGRTMIPRKHGDDGWYGYGEVFFIPEQTDVYLWSMKRADIERIAEAPWIRFLEGRNPGYPAKALNAEFETLREVMQRVREGTATADTRGPSHIPRPVSVGTLLNLMSGANYPGGSGNILHSQVRYFDPERRRAGLPEDVAALVEEIGPQSVTLTLVNTNPVSGRDLVVQAGAYAEHNCSAVEVDGKTIPVGAPAFRVRLEPGAGGRIRIAMNRYSSQPTFAFPWRRP